MQAILIWRVILLHFILSIAREMTESRYKSREDINIFTLTIDSEIALYVLIISQRHLFCYLISFPAIPTEVGFCIASIWSWCHVIAPYVKASLITIIYT